MRTEFRACGPNPLFLFFVGTAQATAVRTQYQPRPDAGRSWPLAWPTFPAAGSGLSGEAVWVYSSGNAVSYLRGNPPIMTSRDAVTKTAAPAQEARHSRNQPRMVRPRLRQAPSPHTDSQKWTIDMPLFNAGSPAIGYSHRHFACPGPCWGNDQEILGSGLAWPDYRHAVAAGWTSLADPS
jgi:hypothetical protein